MHEKSQRISHAFPLLASSSIRLTFFSHRSPHHVLSDVVLLGQVEELADLAGPLGSQAARDGAVGQARDFLLTWGKDAMQRVRGKRIRDVASAPSKEQVSRTSPEEFN